MVVALASAAIVSPVLSASASVSSAAAASSVAVVSAAAASAVPVVALSLCSSSVLLSYALHLLSDHGWQRTHVNEVAHRASVTRLLVVLSAARLAEVAHRGELHHQWATAVVTTIESLQRLLGFLLLAVLEVHVAQHVLTEVANHVKLFQRAVVLNRQAWEDTDRASKSEQTEALKSTPINSSVLLSCSVSVLVDLQFIDDLLGEVDEMILLVDRRHPRLRVDRRQSVHVLNQESLREQRAVVRARTAVAVTTRADLEIKGTEQREEQSRAGRGEPTASQRAVAAPASRLLFSSTDQLTLSSSVP